LKSCVHVGATVPLEPELLDELELVEPLLLLVLPLELLVELLLLLVLLPLELLVDPLAPLVLPPELVVLPPLDVVLPLELVVLPPLDVVLPPELVVLPPLDVLPPLVPLPPSAAELFPLFGSVSAAVPPNAPPSGCSSAPLHAAAAATKPTAMARKERCMVGLRLPGGHGRRYLACFPRETHVEVPENAVDFATLEQFLRRRTERRRRPTLPQTKAPRDAALTRARAS
jgi:hypothetical protein